MKKDRVLITGIAGASLGTEILKSLIAADRYEIYGCDISKFAYGIYQKEFKKTFIVDVNNYINSILDICSKEKIDFIVPGGEETTLLIARNSDMLKKEGIKLGINSPELIEKFSDKEEYFNLLSKLNISIPLTKKITDICDMKQLDYFKFPCIIKPARDSGGSNFIFLADNRGDAELYILYLHDNGKIPLVQEYIPEQEGEFTIGILSLPNEQIVKSIVLKRMFNSKLSVSFRSEKGIISSGYTQGMIDYFPEIRTEAENIARCIHSKGPINIQGRLKNGKLVPFEINARFSASTYFRTMAGFNEIDIFLQYLSTGALDIPKIRPGYYFRSFSEIFIDKDMIK